MDAQNATAVGVQGRDTVKDGFTSATTQGCPSDTAATTGATTMPEPCSNPPAEEGAREDAGTSEAAQAGSSEAAVDSPSEVRNQALAILTQQCALSKEKAEIGLEATADNNTDPAEWAEAALIHLATVQEVEDEAAVLRDAMAASLRETEGNTQPVVPLEDRDDAELKDIFKQSLILGKLRELCGELSVFKAPLRKPVVKMLDLEKQSAKWYPNAHRGISLYFEQMAAECREATALLDVAAAPDAGGSTQGGEHSLRSSSCAPSTSDASPDPHPKPDTNAADSTLTRRKRKGSKERSVKRSRKKSKAAGNPSCPADTDNSTAHHQPNGSTADGDGQAHGNITSAEAPPASHTSCSSLQLNVAVADFLLRKAEELQGILYAMPSTAGEVPIIFRPAGSEPKQQLSTSSIEVVAEGRGEVVQSQLENKHCIELE